MKTLIAMMILTFQMAHARHDYNVFACTKDAKLTFARSKGINPIPVMKVQGKNCDSISKSLTTYFNSLSSSTLLTMRAYCDHRPGHEIQAFRLFIKGSPYWNGRDIVKFKLNAQNNEICEEYADKFGDFLAEHIR